MAGIPAEVRINTATPFPSLVTGANGVAIGKSNGIWTVGLNVPALQTSVPPVGNYNNDYIIVYDSVANTYSKVALASIVGSSGGNVSTGGLTNNEVVFGSGATSIQSLGFPASNGQVLTQNTTGAPFWSNAGTGNVTTSVTLTTNNIILGSGGSAISALAAGVNGQVLTMVSGAPAWQTSTAGTGNVNTTGLTPNEIAYASGATNIISLGFPASNGQVLTQNTSGAPFWSTAGTGNVSTPGTLPANNVVLGNGTTSVIPLATGSNGQVLTLVSGAPNWQTPTSGGGNVSTVGMTINQVTYSSGTNNIVSLGFPASNGQVLTANTTGAPFWQTPIGNVNTSGLSTNAVTYGTSGTTIASLPFPASNGQVLTQNTSGAPFWSSVGSGNVSTAGLTTNEVVYASGANNIVALGFPASNGQVLTQNTTGAPFWAPGGGAVMHASGTGHAAGLAPDPGAVAGQRKFLSEQASWFPILGAYNVAWANVVGDGVTVNSASAISGLWAANPLLYFPAGTYLINGALVSPTGVDGVGIIGDGMYQTVIKSNQTTGDVITIGAFINGVRLIGFRVTRTSTAGSGAGINFNGSTGFAVVRDVQSSKSYYGFYFQTTDYSELSYCVAGGNTGDGNTIGFAFVPGSGGAAQWYTHHCLALNNSGDGFNISGTGANSVADFTELASAGNGGRGFVSAGCSNLRLANCFFGSDVGPEVYIFSSAGSGYYSHVLNQVTVELASGGAGFQFDSGVQDPISMINCSAVQCGYSGIVCGTNTYLNVVGGDFHNNGALGAGGNTFGILAYGSGNLNCQGVRAIAVGFQTNGIVTTGAVQHVSIVGCNADVSNNNAVSKYIPAGANY